MRVGKKSLLNSLPKPSPHPPSFWRTGASDSLLYKLRMILFKEVIEMSIYYLTIHYWNNIRHITYYIEIWLWKLRFLQNSNFLNIHTGYLWSLDKRVESLSDPHRLWQGKAHLALVWGTQMGFFSNSLHEKDL